MTGFQRHLRRPSSVMHKKCLEGISGSKILPMKLMIMKSRTKLTWNKVCILAKGWIRKITVITRNMKLKMTLIYFHLSYPPRVRKIPKNSHLKMKISKDSRAQPQESIKKMIMLIRLLCNASSSWIRKI
jgi:hypothetical protein